MKSLLNEKLIISIKTNIFLKNKILQNSNYYLSAYKNKRTLIIIDKFIDSNKLKYKYIKNSLNFIKNSQIIFNYFSEPTFENLKLIKSKINLSKIDLIITIGGGSTIDIGKGLSIAINYKGSVENLQGMNKFNQQTIPVVSIPTIFGSGAEITPSAVFINERNKVKGGINSNLIQPQITLLDPFLAESNNNKQHVICAFDALVHSIESFHSKLSNEFTKSMSINGAALVLQGIEMLKKNQNKALSNIAKGSIYSIISLMHSEQHLAGASSYQLATHYGYTHAYCGASYLEKSIDLVNKKNNLLFKDLTKELKSKKIIKHNSVKSLINKLKEIKKEYKIENIFLNEIQISKLSKIIYKMPMLNYSPVNLTQKDIKEFLRF